MSTLRVEAKQFKPRTHLSLPQPLPAVVSGRNIYNFEYLINTTVISPRTFTAIHQFVDQSQ